METILSILALGTAGGAVAGGFAGWLVSRQRSDQFEESSSSRVIRPEADDPLDGDVRSWTAGQGIPDVNDLIARKIRFGFDLANRRRRSTR
jgi:hypothetical protein